MRSITHEALVLLFRNRPELAPELLRGDIHDGRLATDELSVLDAGWAHQGARR